MKITKQLWCVFLILILASAVSVVAQDPDTDGDGVEDAIDPDDDNDGVLDRNDCAPLDVTRFASVTEFADADSDGVRDNTIPVNACTSGDAELEFTLNPNGLDNCLNVANANQLDTDHDGTGDECDNTN